MGISLVAILLVINSSRGQQFVFHYPKTPKRREEIDKEKVKIDVPEEFDDLLEEDVVIWPHGNMGDDGDNDNKNNDTDQNNILNKLFGFETRILATILCPKARSSKFQLSIDDLTFVGQPVFLESTATDKASSMNGTLTQKSSNDDNHTPSKTGRITFFHVVFVLEPPEMEVDRQADNVYRHVGTKLTAALEYEQKRCNYVRKEAETILSLRENSGITSLDELMEKILKESTLAQTIQQVYDSISAGRVAHVFVNDYIDLSLQVSPLTPTMLPTESDETSHGYDHYPIIAPYHTLLLLEDPEEILKSIPLDANPTLVQLIQILTPTKRLVDLCAILDCSLAQMFKIAAHLIYWQKAKIIDVVSVRNTYVVSPTADMSLLPTYIEYFNQHFPAELDLVKILASLSSFKPYLISASVFKENRTMYLEAITFLLRKEFVVQLHAYILFMIPQYVKMGLTQENYEKLRTSSENGDKIIGGPMDDDASLISPENEASEGEKEWLKRFTANEPKETLFGRVIKYFNGRHHVEEILFRENIKAREFGKVLNLAGKDAIVVWC